MIGFVLSDNSIKLEEVYLFVLSNNLGDFADKQWIPLLIPVIVMNGHFTSVFVKIHFDYHYGFVMESMA